MQNPLNQLFYESDIKIIESGAMGRTNLKKF